MKVKTKPATKASKQSNSKGTTMVTIGDRGVSCWIGDVRGKQVVPLYSATAEKGDYPAVPLGESTLPWVRHGAGDAAHAWVSFSGHPVNVCTLASALRQKLVKRAKIDGKSVIVPANWDSAQKKPKYVGCEEKLPWGRLESKQVRNADKSLRNGEVLWS